MNRNVPVLSPSRWKQVCHDWSVEERFQEIIPLHDYNTDVKYISIRMLSLSTVLAMLSVSHARRVPSSYHHPWIAGVDRCAFERMNSFMEKVEATAYRETTLFMCLPITSSDFWEAVVVTVLAFE